MRENENESSLIIEMVAMICCFFYLSKKRLAMQFPRILLFTNFCESQKLMKITGI